MGYANKAKSIWRVNQDGEVRDLVHKLSHIFAMPEKAFFDHYNDLVDERDGHSKLYDDWQKADNRIREQIPDFPFSNLWIASKLHKHIPSGSVIHFGIFNSLRSWLHFPVGEGVESACNVGGFGIDGVVSTLIGASLANSQKVFYCVVGDLAFFYDLNALGNRHIGKNVRILLINNGCGAEFKLSSHYGSQFGAQTDDYIAAGHHFGDKSPDLVKHFATDLGFKYLVAHNKAEFTDNISTFINPNNDRPIVFECFTNSDAESEALEQLSAINPYVSPKAAIKSIAKSILPRSTVEKAKSILRS